MISARHPVVVREVALSLPGWPTAADGVRIAHVSDLHFRRWDRVTRCAQQLLLKLRYDLLAVTGDFVDFPVNWYRAADISEEFFGPIRPRFGSFAVLGNHDIRLVADHHDGSLTFLRNDWCRVRIGDAHLAVAGVEQCADGTGDVRDVLRGVPPAVPTVLLAHFPSTVYALPRRNPLLQLSGHTHGGQIRLPWLGCLWTNDRVPRQMSRGLHHVNGTALHVSAGIGASAPLPFRFRCPPEITVLTLRGLGGHVSRCTTPAARGWARSVPDPVAVIDRPKVSTYT